MNTVKKIGLWTALVLAAIIKLPLTLLNVVLNLVEFYLVKLNVKLTKAIGNDCLTESINYGLDVDINGFENFAEVFEDLQEDLA